MTVFELYEYASRKNMLDAHIGILCEHLELPEVDALDMPDYFEFEGVASTIEPNLTKIYTTHRKNERGIDAIWIKCRDGELYGEGW
jgi:hypothetical protein